MQLLTVREFEITLSVDILNPALYVAWRIIFNNYSSSPNGL